MSLQEHSKKRLYEIVQRSLATITSLVREQVYLIDRDVRKIAVLGIHPYELELITPELKDLFVAFKIKVWWGRLYVKPVSDEVDLLLYKDDNAWEQYKQAWQDWLNNKISDEECSRIHGRLFGYSEVSIEYHLTHQKEVVYPIGKIKTGKGTVVHLQEFLTYDPINNRSNIPDFLIEV